jgi:hypothetical protein
MNVDDTPHMPDPDVDGRTRITQDGAYIADQYQNINYQ